MKILTHFFTLLTILKEDVITLLLFIVTVRMPLGASPQI